MLYAPALQYYQWFTRFLVLYAPAWDTVLPVVHEVPCVVCDSLCCTEWFTKLCCMPQHGIQYYQWFTKFLVLYAPAWDSTSGSRGFLCCMPQHGIQYYQWFTRFLVLYAPAWDTVLPVVHEVSCVVCPSMGYSTTSGSRGSLCCMPQHGIQYYQWFMRFLVLYAPAWDTVLPVVHEVPCVVCPSMGYSTTSGSRGFLCCMPQHGIQYYQWFMRFLVLYAPAWDTVLPVVHEVSCVACRRSEIISYMIRCVNQEQRISRPMLTSPI